MNNDLDPRTMHNSFPFQKKLLKRSEISIYIDKKFIEYTLLVMFDRVSDIKSLEKGDKSNKDDGIF